MILQVFNLNIEFFFYINSSFLLKKIKKLYLAKYYIIKGSNKQIYSFIPSHKICCKMISISESKKIK